MQNDTEHRVANRMLHVYRGIRGERIRQNKLIKLKRQQDRECSLQRVKSRRGKYVDTNVVKVVIICDPKKIFFLSSLQA